ncbi:MAG: hypothetical protein ACHREM_16945 [Polyangiales bacterium]
MATLLVAATASAEIDIRIDGPGPPRADASQYPLEIEPHFSFGAENIYGNSGFGAGVRFGIPLLLGHVGSLPDNLAINFGGDIVHYDNCYYSNYCSANYLMVPVAAQWNLFVARRLSVFGEAGAFLYKGWFDRCGPRDGPDCSVPSDFGLLPTVAIGGRVHIGGNTAFTLRLGYPTSTLGLSFL